MTKINKIFTLKKNKFFLDKAKFLIVILDGVGCVNITNRNNLCLDKDSFAFGNAVNAAYTPNLWKLYSSKLFRRLEAHGHFVGLPYSDDIGNSEVGHNAIGSGQIFAQGARLINQAIASGEIYTTATWKKCIERETLTSGQNTLHLCILLSDGNVHSHIDHLLTFIAAAKKFLVKKVRLHLLLDGRDVAPYSALEYVQKLETFLNEVNTIEFDCKIASGGGRSIITMDRYESDWSMVERGYNTHILGEAPHFASITEAIETYREQNNCYDQDLPAFVIAQNDKAIGIVEDNDSFILLNYRGDRAIEFCRALSEKNFCAFKRKRFPLIHFAGIMQYDGDLKIPEHYLVTPPIIHNTMTELLSAQNIKQFACSETQKFGHVTYFWNGNRSGKFNPSIENYVEIPSDKTSFALKPWMKCVEITDRTIAEMENNSFKIGRINFANGDMVGHTGNFAASIVAISALDLSLGRLMAAAKLTDTVLIITADHGNADEMFETDKKNKQVIFDTQGQPKAKTSHTLAPVPFAIYNEDILKADIKLSADIPKAGLANIAATVLNLAGFDTPPFYEPSLIHMHDKT